MMNLDGVDNTRFDPAQMDLADMWILSRAARVRNSVTAALSQYKFNEPLNDLYRFFWNDLCDWYLEWIKPRMRDENQKHIAGSVLAYTLDITLRMLHPFIPFITEGIFQKLNEIMPERSLGKLASPGKAGAIIIAPWPCDNAQLIDDAVESQVDRIQNVIKPIREIRSQYNVPPSKKLSASVSSDTAVCKLLEENSALICDLANLNSFCASDNITKNDNAAVSVVEDMEIYVDDVIDVAAEKKRLEKQKQQVLNGIKPMEAKLANENFVNRAKPEVVEMTRQKHKELTDQLESIEKLLADLK
jgi:valyl-tRNA synthetase